MDSNTADNLIQHLKAAIKRVKMANDAGDPVLSAWLPGAVAAVNDATKAQTEQADPQNTL